VALRVLAKAITPRAAGRAAIAALLRGLVPVPREGGRRKHFTCNVVIDLEGASARVLVLCFARAVSRHCGGQRVEHRGGAAGLCAGGRKKAFIRGREAGLKAFAGLTCCGISPRRCSRQCGAYCAKPT
jgi:hypothetical protein